MAMRQCVAAEVSGWHPGQQPVMLCMAVSGQRVVTKLVCSEAMLALKKREEWLVLAPASDVRNAK